MITKKCDISNKFKVSIDPEILIGGNYYIMGYEVTIYSYEKINVNASLTHVNLVVIDTYSFGYRIIVIKVVKVLLSYSDLSLHLKLRKYTKDKIADSF
jgi:hypothetical protein